MNDQERAKLQIEINEGVFALEKDTQSGDYDIILIDELFSCLDNEQIPVTTIINLIKNKHPQTELAFSAHEVDPDLFQYFDLVTHLRKEKHYYETINLIARKGIEY